MLGQIANTNAKTISSGLATIGVDVFRHTAVGDNLERIADAVTDAMERSDAIVLTGGLGPTPDDITTEAICRALDLSMRRDPRLAGLIERIFTGMGRTMPQANLKQADLPEGARAIEPEGTAPGWYLEHEASMLFALPGVPWEMEAMLTKTVLPILRERTGDLATVSREVLIIGLGESHTHQRIADLVERQSNPTVAYLAGRGQVRVRLTAKGRSEAEALALIEPIELQVRERVGDHAVEGEGGSLAERFANMVKERGVTVAAAESLTGGLLGAELTGIPGASDYFVGSLVCYSNEAKQRVAGVDQKLLAEHGAISEECARALAEGAVRVLGADLGLATTGVAGPEGQEGHRPGTVFVAATLGGATRARKVLGYGDRANVRATAVTWSIDLGRRLLASAP